MAFTVTAYNIMLAGPSDVSSEIEATSDAIERWNALHAEEMGVVLLPVHWAKHATPELGNRPQEILNKQVLDTADVLIAILWSRLGTPTGEAESGTVEEITKHHSSGKPTAVYFCERSIPNDADLDQVQKVRNFREEIMKSGIIKTFRNTEAFGNQVFTDLHRIARKLRNQSWDAKRVSHDAPDDPHRVNASIGSIAQGRGSSESVVEMSESTRKVIDIDPLDPPISTDATELLRTAASHRGQIVHARVLVGETIQAGGRSFNDVRDIREAARWLSALNELVNAGFAQPLGYKREIFQVTDLGYRYIDSVDASGTTA